MLQPSLSLDRRAADCGGSSKADGSRRQAGFGGLLRSLLQLSGRDRFRAAAPDPLSDHLLQDIGLSRADLQALSL
jgi:uncharacterized protein YjiS (DUF1127 family)